MFFEENRNAGNSAELPGTSTKTYPAWVHELIAKELDIAIERYRRRVEIHSASEQEVVKMRPK